MSAVECTNCRVTTRSEMDVARAAGWRIWDGESVTGKQLNVRLCPACVGHREGEEPAKAPSWGVGCHTCHWEYEDEYNEGPLTEKDARSMASDHECEPDTWVKSPDELAAQEERLALLRNRVSVAQLRGVA